MSTRDEHHEIRVLPNLKHIKNMCRNVRRKKGKPRDVINKIEKLIIVVIKKLNGIDSVGISFNHYRQGIDIGQNEVDEGKYEKDRRVFGVCGAAAVFKRDALEKIKINGEYF